MALLRESKRKADQSSTTLQADLWHSMSDLQEMHQEFEAARALQLQRASSCDALLATATAAAALAGGEEEDGTGMELTQLLDRIRAQCDHGRLPVLGERHLGLGTVSNPPPGLVRPSRSGAAAAASRTHGGVLSEVRIYYCIFTCVFFFNVSLMLSWPTASQTHPQDPLQAVP